VNIDSYLVGILYGDGWTYKREAGSYVTCIDQAEKNKRIILDEVVPRFKRMGFELKPYRYFAKHDGTFKWRAQVYSKELFLELKKIFKHILAYFRKLSPNDAKKFIAGFTDAEGTVIKGAIVIYNQNIRLLHAIRRRLRQFGVAPTYIYHYYNSEGLAIMRRECVRKLLREIPALKFKMYHDKPIIRKALES